MTLRELRLSEIPMDDLSRSWAELVERPARAAGMPVPRLVTLHSSYRQVVDPLLGYVRLVAREERDRFVAVVVPELVERRWCHFLLHSHVATALKMMLLFPGRPARGHHQHAVVRAGGPDSPLSFPRPVGGAAAGGRRAVSASGAESRAHLKLVDP